MYIALVGANSPLETFLGGMETYQADVMEGKLLKP